MTAQCAHYRTYAVDTHDRIDCIDCDKSWEGQEIVQMEQRLLRAQFVILALMGCGADGEIGASELTYLQAVEQAKDYFHEPLIKEKL